MDQSELTRQILKKVRQVEIRTNRLAAEALSGSYHSVFKGQGLHFEEVREYAPGDDVRSIDWNVTAKMDRPFVKKFREERELTLMLVVDVSGSGAFGSADQSKRELAAELASVLAFSATRNNDKVGLCLFTDRVEQFMPPRKGRSHVLRVIREVLFHEPQGVGTNISAALDHVNRILKRRAVVFLLSDFLQVLDGKLPVPGTPAGQALFQALALTNRRHDLITAVLSDPRELELPEVGLLTLEDAETGQVVEVDTSTPSVRRRYAEQNKRRQAELRRGLRQAGVDVLELSTDAPYVLPLRQFFENRAKRFR